MHAPATRLVSDRRHPGRVARSDRRYHARVQLDLLVNRFVNGQPYMCRMTDISRTGARLAPLLEPAGTGAVRPRFMGLQFQLPGRSEILTASGELVTDEGSSTGRTVGVRFTNLPPDAAWAIEAFLK
jgi:hypothetical protein